MPGEPTYRHGGDVSSKEARPLRAFKPFLLLLPILLAGGQNAAAQSADPHEIYERNCAQCHAPHAGDFVHDNLALSGNTIVGLKSKRDVRAFLQSGHGKLTPEEIDILVAALTQIRLSGRLFHDKCLICHDRAVRLARTELVIKDGRLVGCFSGRDIERFLKEHGRLDADEVLSMVAVLKRQLETAGE